jgi:pantoate--beta-alanine ligase
VDLDFGQLDKVMEGKFRPGHFGGMAQVVNRLADIIKPANMYFGQKDFQQFVIVQNMLEQQRSPIKAVMCPIIREADGLALSSRNVRLNPETRQKANIIYKTLNKAKSLMETKSPETVQEIALNDLSIEDFRPEYFEIVDGRTLLSVDDFENADYIVACTAVWAGEVRLIDNMILKYEEPLSQNV